MPESLKNHDTWGAQVCRVGTRKCTTYQVLSIFTGESGIWCQKPESVVRPQAEQHFPRFCHIPDTSGLSPPFARRRKIGQQPFRAGSQTTYLVFLIIWLCGPAWLHTDASSFWVRLAASNALMALAASPCALPPLSYMVSDAHRSPVSILFLSGLLAGCSAGVHPCGAT